MRKSITLRAFPESMPTVERLRIAREAGFDAVEVNLEPGMEFTLTSSGAELDRLASMVSTAGLEVSAVYNRQQWSHPINSLDAETRVRGRAIITGLVEAAARLGTRTVLVVPGVVDNSVFVDPPEIIPYQFAYDTSLEAMSELGGQAHAHGITLAVENVWNKFLLSPLEIRDFLTAVASPAVAMYFDVGNVRRTGHPQDWLDVLRDWVHAVQVKDFRCAVDNIDGFVGLLQGDVDWPQVRAALERIGYSGWITGEVLPAYTHYPERLVFETSAAIDTIFEGYSPSRQTSS